MSFARSYRELLAFLGTAAVWQAILAGVLTVLLAAIGIAVDGFTGTLVELVLVLTGALLIEIPFLLLTAIVVERRNAVRRLKEL
ncbi:hypothetical protein [Actinoplanes sp. G11-F43]|uniref:hypothetical protein n=1 Tax=Actinoplanes sp. G11-F43 TaxID=3424130 RepID=UPI003D32AC26